MNVSLKKNSLIYIKDIFNVKTKINDQVNFQVFSMSVALFQFASNIPKRREMNLIKIKRESVILLNERVEFPDRLFFIYSWRQNIITMSEIS